MSAAEVCPDYILISHGHSDHFGDALDIAKRTGAIIVGANELALFCQTQGVNVHAMHIGGNHRFTEQFSVKLTTAFMVLLTMPAVESILVLPVGF